MKIQYCSDLHLEFSANRDFMKANPLVPVGDVLILAGDIVLFRDYRKHKDFFTYVSDNFHKVFWIPGNHEYYHSDVAERSGYVCEKLKDNLFLVNDYTHIENNVRFVFTTLWSKINPTNAWSVYSGMSDFQVIKYRGEKLLVEHYNRLHEQCLTFLKRELETTVSQKTFVVTHHVPSYMNYPEAYKNSTISDGFVTELFDLIDATQPAFWLFGHHHSNVPEFNIGGTTLITNQLGYVKHIEHLNFELAKHVLLL